MEREKYDISEFEVNKNQEKYLLVNLPDDEIFPETKVYTIKDGKYLGKVSKLSLYKLENQNYTPHDIIFYENERIGYFVEGIVKFSTGDELIDTEFKNPLDLIIAKHEHLEKLV